MRSARNARGQLDSLTNRSKDQEHEINRLAQELDVELNNPAVARAIEDGSCSTQRRY
jgi:hypothetical protein